ncbi:protein IQ-DOMAIN 14 [Sesamum angolense]|uniref:Protein IQ-DOMAIN 14 n=1 Tax=Sesamum angolense TaxID=2727404 RepID=A0AAE2BJP8_9LAMI|nr:protein IQ-DOMAIN 14 [Sesamum angolense]
MFFRSFGSCFVDNNENQVEVVISYARRHSNAENMGKKGSWFSAIKRVFTQVPRRSRPMDQKKSNKEKKKGKGILRHGETKSFIPLFKEPSSIEKILGEADQLLIRPPPALDEPRNPPALLGRPTSPRVASPKAAAHRASSPKAASPRAFSPRAASPKAPSPRAVSPRAVSPRVSSPEARPKVFTAGAASSKAAVPKVAQRKKEVSYVQRPEPTLRNQQLSATKIQAAYRGYMLIKVAKLIWLLWRNSIDYVIMFALLISKTEFQSLEGLVRLQGVVRGQNVKRQTANAMKQMQLLVRVQTQIQSRRIQMLENQTLQQQAYRNDREAESTLSKWTLNQLSEAGQNEDWDDSLLKKEEVEERLRKKVEAVIKRERAMAYAYSQDVYSKSLLPKFIVKLMSFGFAETNPKSAQSQLDMRSNGFPWWWNWLERQLPPASTSQSQAAPRSIALTPPRAVSEYRPSAQLHSSNHKHDNHESLTPRSSRSAIPLRARQFQTPNRTPPANSPSGFKYSKPRASVANSAYDVPLKDDDSLMSCPPFSVPNYMIPTASAKAKARANSNPRERFPGTPGTPGNDSRRRFSFPLTPNGGSFKWNKGSNKDSASQMDKHESPRSRDFSVDSAVSMPALVGRKPFNRFV